MLAREVVELVAGAAGIDEVRGDHRVVCRRPAEAQLLRIVRGHGAVCRNRARSRSPASTTTTSSEPATAARPSARRYAELLLVLDQHELLRCALAPGDGLGLEPGRRRPAAPRRACRPGEEAAELEAPEDLLERRAVGRRRDEVGGIDIEREVTAHRREHLRRARLLGVLADRLPARGRQLVSMRDHLLERAVLGDELPGGLVPDPGDPGDVVRGVPLEADEVGHLLRPDAVAELDPLGRVDVDVRDATRRHHQPHVLAAQLERVAVGRDDARADPGLVGLGRERGDHVVRLPPLELEVRVAERLDDRPEVRELLAQQVGHRPAPLLVRLRDLGPVRGPRVPRDATPRGL